MLLHCTTITNTTAQFKMALKRKVHHRESIQKKFGGKTDVFKKYRGKNPFAKPHFWYFAVAFVLSLLLGLFISSPAPRFSLALSDWRDAGYLYRHGEFGASPILE